MTADGLRGRWRRLDEAVSAIGVAVNTPAAEDVTDAIVGVLDAIYPLWEAWKSALGLSSTDQNAEVAGSDSGETVAALVLARGEVVHQLIEPGRGSAYGEGIYGEGIYGSGEWRFRSLSQSLSQSLTSEAMRERARWYANHCDGKVVRPVIDAARAWLAAQPELDAG